MSATPHTRLHSTISDITGIALRPLAAASLLVATCAVWVAILGPITINVLEVCGSTERGRFWFIQLCGLLVIVRFGVHRSRRRRLARSDLRLGTASLTRTLGRADLARFARHESAHAVAGAHVGIVIERVDVLPTSQFNGAVISRPADGTLADSAFAHMVLAVAGHLVDVDGRIHDGGSQSDMRGLLDAAAVILSSGQRPRRFCGQQITTDELIAAARAVAGDALETWAHVREEIEGWLISHPTQVLHGEELARILSPVTAAAHPAGAEHA